MANATKAPTMYAVPAGTRAATCRGETCGMTIYFTVNPATGRPVPINCDVPGGKRPSESKDVGQLDMLTGEEAPVYDGRGTSHFLDCVDADQFGRGAR